MSVAVVAGLAREVDALRRAVRAHADLPVRLTELAHTVADLADEIAARHGAGPGSGLGSWLDRHGIPDPDDSSDQHSETQISAGDGETMTDEPGAGQVLDELAGWVGRVFLRYHDAAAAFPECWCWHPEIVEELLWLQATWQHAYQGETASAAAVGDWHDRYRPGVVRRVKTYAGHCSLARHQPIPGAVVDVNEGRVPYTDAVAAIAEWWTDGQLGIGPAPTADQLARSAARYRREPAARPASLR